MHKIVICRSSSGPVISLIDIGVLVFFFQGILELLVNGLDPLLHTVQALIDTQIYFSDLHFQIAVVVVRITRCELDRGVYVHHWIVGLLPQGGDKAFQTGFGAQEGFFYICCPSESTERILARASADSVRILRMIAVLS